MRSVLLWIYQFTVFKFIRIIYRYLLLVAFQFPFLVFGQKYWQKVDPSIASGALCAIATEDSAYNYGSKSLPSSRTDMISWADRAGRLDIWRYRI